VKRVPPSRTWSPWQTLEPARPLTPAVLAELLDGGQAFRWWPQPDGSWRGQWSGNIGDVRIGESGTLEWRAPSTLATAVGQSLPSYLGLDTFQSQALDQLPWRSDAHLATCLAAFPGLRLLRQPLGETLLCFLCSATKQIVQIKQMVALLAQRLGRPLSLGASVQDLDSARVGHCLPTWMELASVPESELRDCLLGFRARYIRQTAEHLAYLPGWLEETEQLPYAEAKERLCQLPGVGEKVADCVLLFGAGKFEAFPVDVWILRALAQRYGLTGWSPAQVAHFGRAHYGPFAGLAQQYLFAYERSVGGRRKATATE
jgi:N-glycosylase/DNA lyase